jgi:hypothetical protein
MKSIVPPESHAAELSRWRGAHVALWIFHVTHKRLALRLSRRDESEVLYIVAVGCESIAGPFAWEAADVSIVQSGDRARVVDASAGFELGCSSITLVKGPSTEFDTSFEGFMGEDITDRR